MATYYVDPAASGSNNGTSWADAWTGMQLAVDGTNGTQPAAGDTIYMRGTETLTASIDMDGADGTKAAGHINWIGVNASGVEDGTRYVIDANNAATHCLDFSNYNTDYQRLCNIELKNATSNGVDFAGYNGADGLIGANLYIHDNGGKGVGSAQNATWYASFYHCRFENNSSHGFEGEGFFAFCSFSGNGGHGYASNYSPRETIILNCVFHGNTLAGVGQGSRTSGDFRFQADVVAGCVIDGNGDDGIEMPSARDAQFIGNRITGNGGYGLVGGTTYHQFHLAYNYMPDTGQDRANTLGKYSANPIFIHVDGSDTNQLSGTDTDAGYTAPASDNFNLTSSATLRAVEVDIDGTNKGYVTAGLEPEEPSGGGGGTDAVLVPQGLHSIDAGITA